MSRAVRGTTSAESLRNQSHRAATLSLLALPFELRNYHWTFLRIAKHEGCGTDRVTS
jgi:hypothetical protein